MEKLTRNIYPGLFCGIVLLILLGLPGSCFPRVKPVFSFVGLDKVLHLFMFIFFAFTSIWGYRKQYVSNNHVYKKKAIMTTFVVSLLFGAFSELLQEFVFVGREGSLKDYLYDIIGAVFGLLFYVFLYSKNTKNEI